MFIIGSAMFVVGAAYDVIAVERRVIRHRGHAWL